MRERRCLRKVSRFLFIAALASGCGDNARSPTSPGQPTQSPSAPPPPAVDGIGISGVYDLALIASPACTTLPEELKTRKYTATVTQYSPANVFGNVTVILSGASFAGPQGYCAPGNWFSGTIEGDSIRFELETNAVSPCEDWGGLPAIIEQIKPDLYFAIQGLAQGTVADRVISGRVDGSFQLRTGSHDVTACAASDHAYVMRRR